MGPYPPRGALALYSSTSQSAIGQWGWGFDAVRGGFDPGDHRFRIYEPGMAPYRPRVALALSSSPSKSAIGRCSWGFHTVRSGVDKVFVTGLSEL